LFEIRSVLSYNVAQNRECDMVTNTVVRARIEEQVKQEASVILASIGLTVSDAFRLLLKKVVEEKALPFEPLIPNAETIAAIKAARQGDLTTVKDIKGLMSQLDESDPLH
jgi:DNA-damage-inducible protein J